MAKRIKTKIFGPGKKDKAAAEAAAREKQEAIQQRGTAGGRASNKREVEQAPPASTRSPLSPAAHSIQRRLLGLGKLWRKIFGSKKKEAAEQQQLGQHQLEQQQLEQQQLKQQNGKPVEGKPVKGKQQKGKLHEGKQQANTATEKENSKRQVGQALTTSTRSNPPSPATHSR